MAVSILKIQVDRAEADQYFKDFKAFDDQLQGMPEPWKDALRQAKLIQATLVNLQACQKQQTSSLKDSNKQIAVMEKHWKNIGGTVRGINKDVREVMSTVSKLIPGLGTIGGIAGLASLPMLMFAGFSKLMSSVGADRTTNLQMGGISQGSRKAFENTYGRYGFSDAQLRAVAEAQLDPNKRAGLIQALTAAGLSPQDAAQLSEQGTDAGEVMSRLINASRSANPLVLRSMGGPFITPEQVTTIQSALPGEIEGLRSQYQRQTPELDAQAADQRRALEFTSHLSEAFEKLRVGIFNKLIALEPSLDKITNAFGKLVTDLLDSPGFRRFIAELPSKISQFADFLSSEKFTKSLSTVTDNLFKLATASTQLVVSIDKLASFINDPVGFFDNDRKISRNKQQIAIFEAELKDDERYESGKMSPWEKVRYEASHAPDIISGVKRSEKTRETLRHLYAERDALVAASNPTPSLSTGAGNDGRTLNLNTAPMLGVTYVRPDGSARGPATIDEKAQFIGEFIAEGRRRGMNPEQIAGVLGSIAQESHFDPFVRNGIGAYGTSQWLDKSRQRKLEEFRKKNAGKSESWIQARFAWQEMADMGKLNGLRETKSIEEAAIYHRKNVEMPGESEANDAARIRYGKQALNSYGDIMRGTVSTVTGVNLNVVVQNQTGANLTANAAASAI
ncbi:phage tail tip lysozyme [Burkholderia multivorans]|uniref:phage tail tip lysozyme n=1 Tax=Burkholderia multivorans TaxID=87883 RepID=UPI0021C09236|nr:phage tail tip lysozyme [Burkholderia multivorans]